MYFLSTVLYIEQKENFNLILEHWVNSTFIVLD